MYLSVQLAARRLGVSPHTIRRWTDAGVLPCIRTAGGHRRMRREDVDELASLIGGSDQVAARRAREREVDTLVEASIALTSRLELAELLGEIARRVTAILDCHFCAISDYDDETDVVRVLADFDRNGRRIADWKPYALKEFPFTKRLMELQELAVITVGDPAADPAETAIMRHWGEKTLILVPLVHGERSVGLLEVYDHLRERRFTHQELRLARALAGLAAVALHNAEVFGRLARTDSADQRLAAAVDAVVDGLPALAADGSVESVLRAAAALACRAVGGRAAVATWGAAAASVDGDRAGAAPQVSPRGQEQVVTAEAAATSAAASAGTSAAASSASARAASPGTLILSVTLPGAPAGHEARVVRLVAAGAAQVIVLLP